MAKKTLNIFLSASIPIKNRAEGKYYDTADIIGIRDAVISLVSIALPTYHLIWGGHPSITPLITNVLNQLKIREKDCVTLYQSDFFRKKFPNENREINNIIITEDTGDRDSSLEIMRNRMIGSNEFSFAFFIGGMNGCEEEFEKFIELHPASRVIPLASTGGAARILYNLNKTKYDLRFEKDFNFSSLFRDILSKKKIRN